MRLAAVRTLSSAARAFVVIIVALLAVFIVSFILVWHSLPADGVKLHANVDTGIDLYGRRAELLWIPLVTGVMLAGNALLAYGLRRTQPMAVALLLGSIPPLLLGLIGALLFIASLNRGVA